VLQRLSGTQSGCSLTAPSAEPPGNCALSKARRTAMTQHAKIRGEVCFRAGDGVLMPVPDGEVDIEVADDSVTLSWHDDEGNASSAAITRDEYERYRQEGKIRVSAE